MNIISRGNFETENVIPKIRLGTTKHEKQSIIKKLDYINEIMIPVY